MPMKRLGTGISCIALLASVVPASSATAQEGPSAAPVEAAPEIIPTSAFASRSMLQGAQLSPDGTLFAFSMQRDNANYLVIYDAATRKYVDGRNIGEELDLNWFRWAGNRRLLFSLTRLEGKNERPFSRLFYFDLDTQQAHPLALSRMAPSADRVVHVDPDGAYVLASIAPEMWTRPAVYRFDLGGDGPPQGVKVQDAHDDVQYWYADETGTVRVGYGATSNARLTFRYRPDAMSEWKRSAKERIDSDGHDDWNFMGLHSGSDIALTRSVPEGGDRTVLREFNLATGQAGSIIFQDPDADVGDVTFDEENRPLAVGFSGDEYRREWLDPELAAQEKRLGGALPEQWVRVIDIASDRSRMLVQSSSSNDPGALYVYTPADRKLDLFADFRPQIRPAALSKPHDLKYTARDGTEIRGFLTLPKGREAKGLPLVVMPHGGPYGISDGNYYDDEVQLLSNRGYAVVQPNYRGSGGRGQAFEKLGDGQIGRAMQDDLDDAVAYLVKQGTVDPDRVCLVGASYGGYAAVWGAIRNPEIYRCAASWAGVMHFERQLMYQADSLWGRDRGEWSGRVNGDKTSFDLDDVSPAVTVERLKRPVLLAHGEKDTRVPFDQYRLMTSRAKGAGVTLETLELPESGHSFSSEEDELAWYDALVDFLARHNPAD